MAEPPPALGRRASQSGRRFEAGRDPKHRTTDAARGPSRAGGASTPSHHPRKERRIEGAGVPLDGPSLRGHWGGRPPRGVARGHRVPASSSSREGCLSGAMVFAVGRSHVTWARPAGLATRHGEPSGDNKPPPLPVPRTRDQERRAVHGVKGRRPLTTRVEAANAPRAQRETRGRQRGRSRRPGRTGSRDLGPPSCRNSGTGRAARGRQSNFLPTAGAGLAGFESPGGKAVPRTAVPS